MLYSIPFKLRRVHILRIDNTNLCYNNVLIIYILITIITLASIYVL